MSDLPQGPPALPTEKGPLLCPLNMTQGGLQSFCAHCNEEKYLLSIAHVGNRVIFLRLSDPWHSYCTDCVIPPSVVSDISFLSMDPGLSTPTGSSFYLTTIVYYFPPIFRRSFVLSLRCFAFNTINEQAGSSSQYLSDKIMTLYKESYHGQQLSSRVFIILTRILLLFSPARTPFYIILIIP